MNEYEYALEQYGKLDVDIEDALNKMKKIPLSLHCWQGDDIGGFESPGAVLDGGGIQVTGNYPGKASNRPELRQDLETTYRLLPGKHRLNLHAMYGDFGGEKIERDEIGPEHFRSWVDWAKNRVTGLDFNPTLFSHTQADDGFTLSNPSGEVRDFWITHCVKSREIAAYFGREMGSPAVQNIWIPDGSKDYPADRMGYRSRLKDSLDRIFSRKFPREEVLDSVESKLFGIGSEAFVVGSHEFYMGYALTRDIMICIDTGHFHPTESPADKLSSLFQFQDRLLLHVSRPMRWDSDHIVVFNDDIIMLMQELKRCGMIENTHIGLDFFDATVNRIGAWAVGARAALKGLLYALLEPSELLRKYESDGNLFARLALLERMRTLPFGIIWDRYCDTMDVPRDDALIDEVMEYERHVLTHRI